jgi:hypothetical protein
VVQWLVVDARSPSAEPTLPADRAFVVQFRAAPGRATGIGPHGRIEHLVSGETGRFETWSELQGFFERVLDGADAMRTEGAP